MSRFENLCTKQLMIDSLSICPSICPRPWGSVPVKAERCSHTAWARRPTQNYLTARICINAHKHTEAHRYIYQAVSMGRVCLSLPACLSSVSSSQKLVFHFVLHRFQSRPPPPPLFHILLGSYHFPGKGIHADITEASARHCEVHKCQLVPSVKCDQTTVHIKRVADTYGRLMNESFCSIPLCLSLTVAIWAPTVSV